MLDALADLRALQSLLLRAGRDLRGRYGLRGGQGVEKARALRIRPLLKSEPAARIALARQQHLREALRLAEGIAAFQQPHGDLHFKLFGRDMYVPITTTLVLSFLASLIAKYI